MGLLDKIFGSESSSNSKATFSIGKELTDMKQLEEIKDESIQQPVVLFKHSTRCGISRMVLRQFEAEYDFSKEEVAIYFLDLLAHRDISTEISSTFGVAHESPQLLIVKNREVVYHTSHNAIAAQKIREFI